MSVTTAVLLVVALLLAGVYLSWTAGRLDRLHARVDAAWAALDAALVRRAAAVRALEPLLPRARAAELERVAQACLDAGDTGRESVENDLTRTLRQALPALPPDADLHELEAAVTRVGLARSFHNAAVEDTRALRRRRVPRLFRLAGHRRLPHFFEIDDTSLLDSRSGRRA